MLAHTNRILNLVRKAVNPKEQEIDVKYNKPKEKKVIDPEDVLKKELRESVGKIDPIIKKSVEGTLNTMNYRRKTKFEAMDLVVSELDKKVKDLQAKRFDNQEDPRKKAQKNPLTLIDPEAETEDQLDEREAVRAFEQKDTDKLEMILLKSKMRLEEYDQKFKASRPLENLSTVSTNDSIYNRSQIGGLEKSTMSVKIGRSELNHIYERAKSKQSNQSSALLSPGTGLSNSTWVSSTYSASPIKSVSVKSR